MNDARVPYLRLYAVAYAGFWIALIVANLLLAAFMAFAIPSAVGLIVPAAGASFVVGQRWANEIGSRPDAPRVWRLAWAGAVIAIAFQSVLTALDLALRSTQGWAPSLDASLVALVLVGTTATGGLVTAFITRWFVMSGVKNALRIRATRDAPRGGIGA